MDRSCQISSPIQTPETQHWRGFQPDYCQKLPTRFPEEPQKSKGKNDSPKSQVQGPKSFLLIADY
jgi:hypothetical protein